VGSNGSGDTEIRAVSAVSERIGTDFTNRHELIGLIRLSWIRG
jgi:hypothetical protein